uniref:Phosphoglycerate kinase n=1 Tax=Aegilops tauschii subsp. strangulata TaxID=200361 RepID=A0A453G6Q2_AEGTS
MATKRSVGTLGDKDLRGKKVFLRADLNILLDDSQNITDDNCIRASVLSIKFLMAKGAKAILANHLVLRIIGKSVDYGFIPELDWPWHIFTNESWCRQQNSRFPVSFIFKHLS